MPTAFSRSLRSLGADGFRLSVAGLGAGAALLAVWTGWAVVSRITLVGVSGQARIEADRAAHAIQSPVLGRVVRSNLTVGREVKAGDVLLELETEKEQNQIREQGTQMAVLAPELAALRAQVAAEERARDDERSASRAAIEQARAQSREAKASLGYAEEEARRLAKLRAEGLIAQREYERGRAEAERHRALADSSDIAVKRIDQEQRTRESEREARLRRLDADITKLVGQTASLQSAMPRLNYEVERRKVRAPISGRIGEVAMFRVGAIVQEGEKLGAIVPDGTLAVIAQFPPPAAMGRLRTGQKARMRLHGFPWAQYGAVEATVSRVSSEVRDGSVRVELVVAASPVPLQHGMPGNVEVEIERISPASLMLRTAGRMLAEPRSAFTETAQAAQTPSAGSM
jgi:multidrug resistance efflux pump